jgi:hypothetical protein
MALVIYLRKYFRPSWRVGCLALLLTATYVYLALDQQARVRAQARQARNVFDHVAIAHNAGLEAPFAFVVLGLVAVLWMVFAVGGILRARDFRRGIETDPDTISLGRIDTRPH